EGRHADSAVTAKGGDAGRVVLADDRQGCVELAEDGGLGFHAVAFLQSGVIEIDGDEGSRSVVLGENGLEGFGAHRVAAAGDVEGELRGEGADARAPGALPLGPYEAEVLSSRGHHEVSFPRPTACRARFHDDGTWGPRPHIGGLHQLVNALWITKSRF